MTDKQLLESDCIIIVAFSGGKDSIAMVLHLLEIGIPSHRIILHHHDVDGNGEQLFDWACTKSYCIAFAEAIGLDLLFSYRKGGISRAIYRKDEPRQDVMFQDKPGGGYYRAISRQTALNTRLKFPAISPDLRTRWCSSEVKIDVLKTAITHNPDYMGKDIVILTGERWLESTGRAKYKKVETSRLSNSTRTVIQYRIIIEWTEQMVWDIMLRWGIQPHPCYMLGWNRCSCQICIFNEAAIWATSTAITPHKTERIAAIETDIGHTLHHKKTILEYVDGGTALENLDPYWTAQATGEFTAPIVIPVEKWILPRGAFKKQKAGAV